MAKETRKVHISVTSNASKNLNKGTVAAKGLSGSLKGVGAAANIATGGIRAMTMALISSGVGAIVVALGSLAAGFGAVVNKSAEFEENMSKLRAVNQENFDTTEELNKAMSKMSDKAKELGRTTNKTAMEVLQLETVLSKMGFTAQEVVDSTDSVLFASNALGGGMAETAELVGGVQKAFSLLATDSKRIADVLSLSSNKTRLGFDSITEAFAKAGPMAAAAGLSLETTAAALGITVDVLGQGSVAGTAFASLLVELNNKGMTMQQSFDAINNSTNKLGTAMRIAGRRGGQALFALANQSLDTESKFYKLQEAFNGADGAAERMSITMNDNLKGDFKRLESAWEGLMLGLDDGTGMLNKVSRLFTKGLTNAISFFSEGMLKAGVEWDILMLEFENGGIYLDMAKEYFTKFSKDISLWAIDIQEAISEVPIIGGAIDKSRLEAQRSQLNSELNASKELIEGFANEIHENDLKKVGLRLNFKKEADAREIENKKRLLKKFTDTQGQADEDKRKKEIEAKKAFLAKLKKLEEDTDDVTALDKIERKRQRHIAELKTIMKDTDERRKVEAAINAIYDKQRDKQVADNLEKRKKLFDDFSKQFGIESDDPFAKLQLEKEAHIKELEQLELHETEKWVLRMRIEDYYKSEQAKLDEQKRLDKAEQDRLEYETKRGLILDGLDLAIQASGEESKIGQALLKVKTAFMLAEMAMKMKVMIMNLKAQAKEGVIGTKIKAASQSASIGEGVANSTKLGFPFNVIPLALMAAQSVMMIQNMNKSKKEMQQATAGLGGGSLGGGGGATAIQPPAFNVIGQTTAGENLIADTIQGANNRPMRAFVVDKDITSSQELARNTENEASIG